MSTLKTTKYNEFVRAYARKCRRDGKRFLISDAARFWSRLEGGAWADLFHPAKVPTQAQYDKALDNYADMQKYYADRQAVVDQNKVAADALALELAKERADAALYRAQHPQGTKLTVTKMSTHAQPPAEITYNAAKNSITNLAAEPSKAFPREPVKHAAKPEQVSRSLFHTERPSERPSESRAESFLSGLRRTSEPRRPESFLSDLRLGRSEPAPKPKSECDTKCKKWLKDNYHHLTGHHHFQDTKSFVNHLLKE